MWKPVVGSPLFGTIAVVEGISVFRRNPFLAKGFKIGLFPQLVHKGVDLQ
jgi:hypothetical protein